VQRSSWWTSRNSLPSLSRLSCSLRDLCPQSKHTLDVFLSGVEIVGTRLWMASAQSTAWRGGECRMLGLRPQSPYVMTRRRLSVLKR
jgi:hypothetical protein